MVDFRLEVVEAEADLQPHLESAGEVVEEEAVVASWAFVKVTACVRNVERESDLLSLPRMSLCTSHKFVTCKRGAPPCPSLWLSFLSGNYLAGRTQGGQKYSATSRKT